MILMDTCVIIWDAISSSKLTEKARLAIEKADAHNALMISDISIWEIAMLIKKRRLEIDSTPGNFLNLFLQTRNISVQSISPEIAELSVNFGSELNNDTAERIIAATSIMSNAQLVTANANLLESELLDTIW